MKKVNLERKIDFAIDDAINGLRASQDLSVDTRDRLMKYHLERIVSILCMVDDWEVEQRCTYYCLSEIENNMKNYLLEKKLKGEIRNENGNG